MNKNDVLIMTLPNYHPPKEPTEISNMGDIQFDLVNLINTMATYAPRGRMENNTEFRHPIPYLILKRDVDGVSEYYMYQRGKGIGEERLLGNTSIGIGGHVDLPMDQLADISERPPYDILMAGIRRELAEEIAVPGIDWSTFDIGECVVTIESNDTPVDSVHLGMIYVLDVTAGDTDAAHMLEEELDSIGWRTLDQLKDEPKLESWSKLILPYL